MRAMRLAALLVALAGPAWAANDEKPQPYTGPAISRSDWAAFDVCRRTAAAPNICTMKYSNTEEGALSLADLLVTACQRIENKKNSSCLEELAYIKQRWGYQR